MTSGTANILNNASDHRNRFCFSGLSTTLHDAFEAGSFQNAGLIHELRL